MVTNILSESLISAGPQLANKRVGLRALSDDQAELNATADLKVGVAVEIKVNAEDACHIRTKMSWAANL